MPRPQRSRPPRAWPGRLPWLAGTPPGHVRAGQTAAAPSVQAQASSWRLQQLPVQHGLQFGQREPEPRLGGALRDAGRERDLTVGQPLEVGKLDDSALAVREQADGVAHYPRDRRGRHLFARREVRLPGGQPVVPLLPRDPAKFAADRVHRAMPGHNDEVGAQLPDGGVIPAGMARELDEYVLHNVLRGGALPQDPQRGTVYGRPEAVEDLRESAIVSSR